MKLLSDHLHVEPQNVQVRQTKTKQALKPYEQTGSSRPRADYLLTTEGVLSFMEHRPRLTKFIVFGRLELE